MHDICLPIVLQENPLHPLITDNKMGHTFRKVIIDKLQDINIEKLCNTGKDVTGGEPCYIVYGKWLCSTSSDSFHEVHSVCNRPI